jgi:hypothetical protein
VGEYKYVKNGVEKINTLPNLLINHSNRFNYNLTLNIITRPLPNRTDICRVSDPNGVMVGGAFDDPEIDILGFMTKQP